MKKFLVLCLLAPVAHAGSKFSRQCEVYVQPNFRSDRLCQKSAGAPILKVRPGRSGFLRIETNDCDGYVSMTCVTTSEERSSRGLSTSVDRLERNESVAELGTTRIGPVLSAAGIWGKPGTASSSSGGTAFLFGVQASLDFGTSFRVTAIPNYQVLTLSRTVDGTGSITDATPVEFTQKVGYFGLALLGGLGLGGAAVDGTASSWWLEGGLELLTPVSAKQTDNFGGELSFSGADKLLLIEAGPSGDFLLSRDLWLNGAVRLFYNLSAKNSSSLLGVRLLLALSFGV